MVDAYPVWTANGDSLFFRRYETSSYGPAGIYKISKNGGLPRAIADLPPGVLLVGFHASPSDAVLSATFGSVLITLDTRVGVPAVRFYSKNGVNSADWLDETRLILSRSFLDPGETQDSSGLAILDLNASSLSPLHVKGASVFGSEVRVSPDRSWIAYIYATALYVVRPDGSELRKVADPGPGLFFNSPEWADAGTLVMVSQAGRGLPRTAIYNVRGSGSVPQSWWIGYFAAMSPDFANVATFGRDLVGPDRDAFVLYRRRLDDANGSTAAQITLWEPTSAILPP